MKLEIRTLLLSGFCYPPSTVDFRFKVELNLLNSSPDYKHARHGVEHFAATHDCH